jgi:hypothetical protein
VEVRHDEGVANHIGPGPCVGIRKGEGGKTAGEFTGQSLSRERLEFGCRRCCEYGRQNREMRKSRVSRWLGVVVEPGMLRSIFQMLP